MAIKTSILPFNELTPTTLYALLALRSEVFVVEQQCPYQDIDFKDQQAQHVLMYEDEELIAYARILASTNKDLSFGRVLTAPNRRGQKLGQQLVERVLEYLQTHYPKRAILISAQLYLQHFYQAFGFKPTGEPFDLDGIPHIWMKKSQ